MSTLQATEVLNFILLEGCGHWSYTLTGVKFDIFLKTRHWTARPRHQAKTLKCASRPRHISRLPVPGIYFSICSTIYMIQLIKLVRCRCNICCYVSSFRWLLFCSMCVLLAMLVCWDVFCRLFEAYARCCTEKDRNMLLADLKFGPTKR